MKHKDRVKLAEELKQLKFQDDTPVEGNARCSICGKHIWKFGTRAHIVREAQRHYKTKHNPSE